MSVKPKWITILTQSASARNDPFKGLICDGIYHYEIFTTGTPNENEDPEHWLRCRKKNSNFGRRELDCKCNCDFEIEQAEERTRTVTEERFKKVVEEDNKERTMLDTVHPEAEGFIEKVTPKKTEEDLFFFKCAGCGNHHFRHAGYMKAMLPYMRANKEKKVDIHDSEVAVCTKCKKSYIWLNEQMYDVSDKIDVEVWEKTEKELHKATGPGGQC